jgi:hypothetical protein
MPRRVVFLLFFLFLSALANAQNQGVEIIGIIDLNETPPPRPPADRPVWLSLAQGEIERFRNLHALGYRLMLHFPGPEAGFSSTDELADQAEEIRGYLPNLGDNYGACLVGDPDHPLPQSIFEKVPDLSFALKSLALACRSGNPEAEVFLGFVDTAAFRSFARLLSEQALGAYVDGYVVTSADFTGLQRLIRNDQPNAAVFSMEHAPALPEKFIPSMFSAFQSNRFHLMAPLPAANYKPFLSLLSLLTPDTSPTIQGDRTPVFLSASGKPIPGFGGLNFTNFRTGQTHIAIVPPEVPQPSYYVVPTTDVAEPVLHDITGAADYPLKASAVAAEDKSYIGLPGLKRPMLLSYKSAGKEERRVEEISGAYDLPLEIIMARVQAVESSQREALKNYSAEARIEYHFKLPGGYALVDVAYDNEFFFDPAVGQEWRLKKMYFNGVPWKGKKIPELPIPEPEQVVTLPLNLTLNKDYDYSLVRTETVEGRQTWVIEFTPASDRPLYKGQVWIDQKTFQRIKLSATQTHLAAPITSNDETLQFQLQQTPAGNFNLLSGTSGQQIFSAAGRQVFAERTIRFESFVINGDDFESRRAAAYSSNDLMTRQTAQGLKALKKDAAGNRVVQMEPDTSRHFWVFGAFYDQALGFPFPFGGKNILDYNWRKSGTQLNMLIAVAFNVLSLSDPEFLRKGSDARIEAALFTVPTTDRLYIDGKEIKSDDLWMFREFGNAGMGFNLGEYGKITPGLQFAFYKYFDTSDTSADFETPGAHLDLGPTLELNYTRKGYSLSAAFASHFRTNWDAWGTPGSPGQLDPQRQYWQLQTTLNKSFYPAPLHKIAFSMTYLKGRHLDRFSAYQFFYLGDLSLAGFSGSGIRFQEGTLTKASYEFNVFDLFRLGGRAELGIVKPLYESNYQKHGGIGAYGTVFGPWSLVIDFDLGYAAYSDLPSARRQFTASLMLLKLI